MHSEASAEEAGSTLTIDLAAIVGNWRTLAGLAGPAECGAAIKANAYGLGIEAVGVALDRAGCQSFFVAHVEEGRRLRAVAPKAVIYVLNGFQRAAAGSYVAARLTAVVGSIEEFSALLDLAMHGARIPYALHIDTGMNRLGFSPDAFPALLSAGTFDQLMPRLIMSHFVSSECSDDPMNAAQIAAFSSIRNGWISRYEPDRSKHDSFSFSLSNSSGIFLKEQPLFDLVRPGYALYGGNPLPGQDNPTSAVVRLESRIIQLREISRGASVGYNANWVAARDSKLATISLGYADGIFRSLSNMTGQTRGGAAMVNGTPCPFAGRVSMDLITLDVTDAGPISLGDTAILLDDSVTIDHMAERAGTNGYNILTNLGQRFHRRYIGG